MCVASSCVTSRAVLATIACQIHGRVRRYTSPDEHAFYPEALPALVLPPLTYPKVTPGAHAPGVGRRWTVVPLSGTR